MQGILGIIGSGSGRVLAVLLAMGVLAGCDTLFGYEDEITVTTQPAGATCALRADGRQISTFFTPGTAIVDDWDQDIDVVCRLAGYETTAAPVESDAVFLRLRALPGGGTAPAAGFGTGVPSSGGAGGPYRVLLGSFWSEAEAAQAWSVAASTHRDLISEVNRGVFPYAVADRTYWGVFALNMSLPMAEALCDRRRARGAACQPEL